MKNILVACNNRNKEWCPFGAIDCECDAYMPRELEAGESIDFTCTDKYDDERECIFEKVSDDSITKKIFIPMVKTVQKIMPRYLVKDLQENERICPVCHGLGVTIENNIYGIEDDTSEAARREMFPYKKQSLSFCQSCYNGVQKLCEFCGEPFKQPGYRHCDCDGFKRDEEEKEMRKREEVVAKAKEIQESDVETYLYCEEFDSFYPDMDDFFDSYACNYNDEQIYVKPDKLWVCTEKQIWMDAYSLTENACDELHEDAFEQCDIASLQDMLDGWCIEQTGTTTYYPCFKKYVMIDWSRYDE